MQSESNEAARKAARYASFKKYRAKHREKYRRLHRESYHRNRDTNLAYMRRYSLSKAYKLTPDQYEVLLAAQSGVCAICAGTNPSGKRLAVDHCHDSGKVRGLLCSRCNTMLGQSRDNVDILRSAIGYLVRHL